MNKHKLPDFITNTNFNNETLEAVEVERDLIRRLSLEYIYNAIICLFEENKDLNKVSLDVYRGSKGVGYDGLGIKSFASDGNYESGGSFFSMMIKDQFKMVYSGRWCTQTFRNFDSKKNIYDEIIHGFDTEILSRINTAGGIVLCQNNVDGFKVLSKVLFGNENNEELYYDIFSDANINISRNIGAKNYIVRSLEHLQNLDCQIAILSVKKLFGTHNFKSLEISINQDDLGFLSPEYSIEFSDSKVNFNDCEKNIKILLDNIINDGMLVQLFQSPQIKLNDSNCMEALSKMLFVDKNDGKNFLITFQRDELEVNIKNEEVFVRKKYKI